LPDFNYQATFLLITRFYPDIRSEDMVIINGSAANFVEYPTNCISKWLIDTDMCSLRQLGIRCFEIIICSRWIIL